ncbi:MAG: hypothetical protein ACRC1H_11125 [Caldilineaceae bacterium]
MRFSKSAALQALDARSDRIASEQRFDRGNGTSQLCPRGASESEVARILRAVEYGRMKAFEDFACAIEEGFAFEALAAKERQ